MPRCRYLRFLAAMLGALALAGALPGADPAWKTIPRKSWKGRTDADIKGLKGSWAAAVAYPADFSISERRTRISDITPDLDPNDILKDAYGDHFHFVFHRHECQGVFGHQHEGVSAGMGQREGSR